MAKGTKTGGRAAGTPNKTTSTVRDALAALGCDVFSGMAQIALGNVICNVCLGKLVSPVQLPDGEHAAGCFGDPCICDGITLRKCQSCKGTGREIVSPELRGKMYAELAKYVEPQLKAIDHSNTDGTLRPTWTVVKPELKIA